MAWWMYLLIFAILCITIMVCFNIKTKAVTRISDNDTRLRELELMSEEQREEYFKKNKVSSRKRIPSPYGIERVMARNGRWGYAVTKDGEKINHNGTYEVWMELHQVRQLVRELERNDGCEQTVF